MGTDITVVLEIWQGGQWKYCGTVVSSPFRCYETFCLLCGIRKEVVGHTDFKPQIPPRGMPNDADTDTKSLSDEWHSPTSYMTIEELLNIDPARLSSTRISMEELAVRWKDFVDNIVAHLAHGHSQHVYRIVFWFSW